MFDRSVSRLPGQFGGSSIMTKTNILVSPTSPDTWRLTLSSPCVSFSDDTFRYELGMMCDGVILAGLCELIIVLGAYLDTRHEWKLGFNFRQYH